MTLSYLKTLVCDKCSLTIVFDNFLSLKCIVSGNYPPSLLLFDFDPHIHLSLIHFRKTDIPQKILEVSSYRPPIFLGGWCHEQVYFCSGNIYITLCFPIKIKFQKFYPCGFLCSWNVNKILSFCNWYGFWHPINLELNVPDVWCLSKQ